MTYEVVQVDVEKPIELAEKEYKDRYPDGDIKEAAYLVIFDSPRLTERERPRILLEKRSPKDKWAPNKFSPPGGKVDISDFAKPTSRIPLFLKRPAMLHDAWRYTMDREFSEEIGGEEYSTRKSVYLGTTKGELPGFLIHVYTAFFGPRPSRQEGGPRYYAPPEIKPKEKKAKELKWFDVDNLPRDQMSEGARDVVDFATSKIRELGLARLREDIEKGRR